MPRASVLALLLGSAISGCANINEHVRVEGWPELRVIEHHVPERVMRERCARFGTLPMACAEFHFTAGECHIWFSSDFPPSMFVVKHEHLHCKGYDHVGDSNMQEALARFHTRTER